MKSNRDFDIETSKRVDFIRSVLNTAKASGVVFGNSGGKDCALVGILCKMACPETVGLILPCGMNSAVEKDIADAKALASLYNIESRIYDISETKNVLLNELSKDGKLSHSAEINIIPRLRMMSLYAIAANENKLVAGTGNRSERYMGYFTKWGDGAYDFNPIADLTATEVLQYLEYLNAPSQIISKPPSAGLFEGQTDEADMGVSYKSIDEYLISGTCSAEDLKIIERYHRTSEHKRQAPPLFS